MVAKAVAAPVKWTSDSIRNALLDLSDKRNWTTNRLAAELEMSQVSLEAFLNGDVATIKLRNKGARLLERYDYEPPLTEPAPLRPRSAIAYLAEQPDKAETALTPEQEAYVEEFTSPAFVGRQLAEIEAEAAAEDEARLIAALARAGDECDRKYDSNGTAEEWAVAVIAEARKQGVTLIAPPMPEPTYTLTFTTPLFDTLRALVETSRHGTPEEGELLDQIADLLANATPDATEAN